MSSLSQYIGTRLARFLGNHCDPIGLAHVFAECGYTCFPGKPNKMRRPDVSCVRTDRLPFDEIGDGFIPIRPDLAVEVISPNDRVYDLEEKLDDYRDAGIPLIWLFYPPTRRVRVFRPRGRLDQARPRRRADRRGCPPRLPLPGGRPLRRPARSGHRVRPAEPSRARRGAPGGEMARGQLAGLAHPERSGPHDRARRVDRPTKETVTIPRQQGERDLGLN